MEATDLYMNYALNVALAGIHVGVIPIGAVVFFGIPGVVVRESENFKGVRDFLESTGVEVLHLDLPECRQPMASIHQRPP